MFCLRSCFSFSYIFRYTGWWNVDVWYWQWQIVTLCESSGVVDFVLICKGISIMITIVSPSVTVLQVREWEQYHELCSGKGSKLGEWSGIKELWFKFWLADFDEQCCLVWFLVWGSYIWFVTGGFWCECWQIQIESPSYTLFGIVRWLINVVVTWSVFLWNFQKPYAIWF